MEPPSKRPKPANRVTLCELEELCQRDRLEVLGPLLEKINQQISTKKQFIQDFVGQPRQNAVSYMKH